MTLLAEIRHRQGRLLGRMEGLGFPLQREAELFPTGRGGMRKIIGLAGGACPPVVCDHSPD